MEQGGFRVLRKARVGLDDSEGCGVWFKSFVGLRRAFHGFV